MFHDSSVDEAMLENGASIDLCNCKAVASETQLHNENIYGKKIDSREARQVQEEGSEFN